MSTWNDEEHDLLDGLIRQLEQAWQADGTASWPSSFPRQAIRRGRPPCWR